MEATTDLVRPVDVEAHDGYRIWLRFADGIDGEIDLSGLLTEPERA